MPVPDDPDPHCYCQAFWWTRTRVCTLAAKKGMYESMYGVMHQGNVSNKLSQKDAAVDAQVYALHLGQTAPPPSSQVQVGKTIPTNDGPTVTLRTRNEAQGVVNGT